MSLIEQNNLLNRYPGVKPFSVNEQFLFFGRANELETLNGLIYIQQIVVLYGKSGYGKSSLINAGIIPLLKENENWTYFSIRFNNFSGKEIGQNLSPAKTVNKRLSENLALAPGSELKDFIKDEDSFWYWIKLHQFKNPKARFILFFDQFEELFTYPKEQIVEFSEQFSQLLYNTVPPKFRKKIAELEDINPLSNELHNFLYDKPEIKVLFSIRSDRLALMNYLTDRHPAILQNCYELNALNLTDAASAITEPAKLLPETAFKSPVFEFTKDAVTKILNSIANKQDGKIEAATLQIVCRYIEDNLVITNNHKIITEDFLGDITDIFQQYYEGILSKLPTDERPRAQRLIEDELIDGGRRNPLTEGYIQKRFGLSPGLLVQLEESSLLRKERDAAGRVLYEVSHDSLVEAINKVAVSRREIDEKEKRKVLEMQVENERQRADDLKDLKDKAVFRFRLAVGMVVISLVVAAFALFFRHQAKLLADEAQAAEASALTAEKNAKIEENKANIALYNFRKEQLMSRAKYLMDIGDDFFSNKGFGHIQNARRNYKNAMDSIKGYADDSLFRELKRKITLCK